MSAFLCSRGHLFKTQFGADNCARCRRIAVRRRIRQAPLFVAAVVPRRAKR